MQIQNILDELEFFSPKFPRHALQEAIHQRTEITPILLETLKGWLDGDVKELAEGDYYLHIYTFYLLAQFGEKQAYPLMIDFLIDAGESAEELFGDVLTEDMGRILASVYDGNFAPLKRLIYDEKIYNFTRSQGVAAIVTLYAENIISRDEILQQFQSIFEYLFTETNNPEQEKDDLLGTNLIAGCLDIAARELTEQVFQAFDKGLVDPMYIGLKEAEKDLEVPLDQALSELQERRIYRLVKDVITETEWWACFADRTEIEKEEIKKLEKFLVKSAHRSEKPDGFSMPVSDFDHAKKKAKQKQQKLARKKNRTKKK